MATIRQRRLAWGRGDLFAGPGNASQPGWRSLVVNCLVVVALSLILRILFNLR